MAGSSQIQTKIQLKADVFVHADGLTNEQITDCLLKPCRRIEDTLADLRAQRGGGGKPTVCVLPEGPITIPYVSS